MSSTPRSSSSSVTSPTKGLNSASVSNTKALYSCGAAIATSSRDWNADFQQLWESDTGSLEAAKTRWNHLTDLVTDFQSVGIDLATRIVEETGSVSELSGHPGYYRIGNVLIRTWSELRDARKYVNGLSRALAANSRDVCVPLTSLCLIRGVAFTAQAIIPVDKTPMIVYRGDGHCDLHQHYIEESLALRLIHSANLSIECLEGQWKLAGLELVEGLDGRVYVVEANGLLGPTVTFGDRRSHVRPETILSAPKAVKATGTLDIDDTIQHAARLLVQSAESAATSESRSSGTPPLLGERSASGSISHSQSGILSPSAASGREDMKQHMAMLKLIKESGVPMVALGRLYDAVRGEGFTASSSFSGTDQNPTEAARAQVCRRIMTEMIVRVAKSALLHEINSKHLSSDTEALERLLSKTLAGVFESDMRRLDAKIVSQLARKYEFSEIERKDQLRDALCAARAMHRPVVIRRVCDLIGARLQSKGTPIWSAVAHWSLLPAASSPDNMSLNQLDFAYSAASKERSRAALGRSLAQAQLWDYEWDAADATLREVEEITLNMFGLESAQDVHVKMARMQVALARRPPDVSAAHEVLQDAINATTPLSGEMSLPILRLHSRAAQMYLKAKRPVEACDHFLFAQRLLKDVLDEYNGGEWMTKLYSGLLRCKLMDDRGVVNVEIGVLCDEVVEFAPKSVQRAVLHRLLLDLGSYLIEKKDYERGCKTYMQAVETARTVFHDDSVPVVETLSDAGFAYYSWDRNVHRKTITELMEAASATARRVHGERSLEHAVTLNNLGAFLMQVDDLSHALRSLQKAYRLFDDVTDRSNPNFKACRKNLGILKNRIRVRAITMIQRKFRSYRSKLDQRGETTRRERDVLVHEESERRADTEALQLESHTQIEADAKEERQSIEADEANKAVHAKNRLEQTDALDEERVARETIDDEYLVEFLSLVSLHEKEIRELEDSAINEQRRVQEVGAIEAEESRARSKIESDELREFLETKDEATASRTAVRQGEARKASEDDEATARLKIVAEEHEKRQIIRNVMSANLDLINAREEDDAKAQEALEKAEVAGRAETEDSEEEGRAGLVKDESTARAGIPTQSPLAASMSTRSLSASSGLVSGMMNPSSARALLWTTFVGYRIRFEMNRARVGAVAAQVQLHARARQSAKLVQQKFEARLQVATQVTVIQTALRYRAATGLVLARHASQLLRNMRGFAARHRLGERYWQRMLANLRSDRKKLQTSEAAMRREIDTEEREGRRVLHQTSLRIRERQRQLQDLVRQAVEARNAWSDKFSKLESEESRRRKNIADDAQFTWGAMMAQERRKRATLKKRSDARNSPENRVASGGSHSEMSAQTDEAETALTLPKIVTIRRRPPSQGQIQRMRSQAPGSRPLTQQSQFSRSSPSSSRARRRPSTRSEYRQSGNSSATPPVDEDIAWSVQQDESRTASRSLVVVGDAEVVDDGYSPDGVVATLSGFELDEGMLQILDFEQELLVMKELLEERGADLAHQLQIARERREKASLALLPSTGGTAWTPARPDGLPAPLVRMGRVVGTVAHPSQQHAEMLRRSRSSPRLQGEERPHGSPSAGSGLSQRQPRPPWQQSDVLQKLPEIDQLRTVVDEYTMGWERNAKVQHVNDMKTYLKSAPRSTPASLRPRDASSSSRRRSPSSRTSASSKPRRGSSVQ